MTLIERFYVCERHILLFSGFVLSVVDPPTNYSTNDCPNRDPKVSARSICCFLEVSACSSSSSSSSPVPGCNSTEINVAFPNSVEIGFTLHSCTIRGVHFDISTYRVFFVRVCLTSVAPF